MNFFMALLGFGRGGSLTTDRESGMKRWSMLSEVDVNISNQTFLYAVG
jgi:hypothetical protein